MTSSLWKYFFATAILFGASAQADVHGAAEATDVSLPRTRAEISEYRKTSSLQDVVRFLEGHFEAMESRLSKGDYIISTAQPLGILIFQLLEPESLDGLAAWNFLDEEIQLNKHYPILKILSPVNCPTGIVQD